jgi:hypothetical protein
MAFRQGNQIMCVPERETVHTGRRQSGDGGGARVKCGMQPIQMQPQSKQPRIASCKLGDQLAIKLPVSPLV